MTFQRPRVQVNVTPTVPVDSSGNPLYGEYGSRDKPSWPLVLEKAYAKQYGDGKGYPGIDHGADPSVALQHLTGWDTEKDAVSGLSFQNMQDARDGGWTMVADNCGVKGHEKSCHAFSLQNVYSGKDGKQWVELYNPWNGSGGTNGHFTIDWPTFQSTFGNVESAKKPSSGAKKGVGTWHW